MLFKFHDLLKNYIEEFSRLVREHFDSVITGVAVGALEGHDLLKSIKSIRPHLKTLVITADEGNIKQMSCVNAIIGKNSTMVRDVVEAYNSFSDIKDFDSASLSQIKAPQRILFIDDDLFIHALIKKTLEGEEGLEQLNTHILGHVSKPFPPKDLFPHILNLWSQK